VDTDDYEVGDLIAYGHSSPELGLVVGVNAETIRVRWLESYVSADGQTVWEDEFIPSLDPEAVRLLHRG